MEMGAIEKARAKTVIAELDEPFLAALQQELYDRWHDQFLAKAREELEPEYEEKFQQRCERWEDERSGYRKALQDEFDEQREQDRERDRRRIREEFAERFETTKEAQAEAQQRLQHADEQILMLIKTLLPTDRKVFLHEYGFETLDVWSLNTQVLHRHQLQLMHALTASTRRMVKVRVGQAEWKTATQFWLETYQAPDTPTNNGVVPPAYYR